MFRLTKEEFSKVLNGAYLSQIYLDKIEFELLKIQRDIKHGCPEPARLFLPIGVTDSTHIIFPLCPTELTVKTPINPSIIDTVCKEVKEAGFACTFGFEIELTRFEYGTGNVERQYGFIVTWND